MLALVDIVVSCNHGVASLKESRVAGLQGETRHQELHEDNIPFGALRRCCGSF